jgi:glycosyltransferase involved in cell wall biosynthesis
MKNYCFPEVTLLVTHYNRSGSLLRLLQTFKELNCTFGETVVSDDGSSKEHLKTLLALKQQFNFNLVLTDTNKGLGNNINKGQRAVTTALTLYVQEDFVPTKQFPENFENAIKCFEELPDLDLVRFYAYHSYPYLKPYKYGYSEMKFRIWYLDYKKIYFYSDHPHLRRGNFLEKFGNYAENIKGDRTEYRKCVEVLQKRPRGLFFNEYSTLFEQINSSDEPSTMARSNWTQTDNAIVAVVRYFYRQFKYNFDVLFYKAKA